MARHTRPFLGSVFAGVLVAPLLVVALASGGQADEGDTLSTTGLGAQGQLGHGSTASRTSFGPVNTLVGVDEVAGGREHVVALIDGAVWSWGDGIKGATGLGSTAIRTSPALVTGVATGTTTVTEVAAGHYHSLARLSDGTVRTWGFNAMGQLGDGTTTKRLRPVTITGLADVVDVVGGRDMSYARLADGTVRSWGGGANGELGNGTLTAQADQAGDGHRPDRRGGARRRAQPRPGAPFRRHGDGVGSQLVGPARQRHEDLPLHPGRRSPASPARSPSPRARTTRWPCSPTDASSPGARPVGASSATAVRRTAPRPSR